MTTKNAIHREQQTLDPCPVCKHSSDHEGLLGCMETVDGGHCGCTVTATVTGDAVTLTSPASDNPPRTPYAGTSGWSGSDTSRERAERDDADGTTSHRQQQALSALRTAGAQGLTWKEVGARFGWHHGQASGVLSVLHKEGEIDRLTQRRNRCQVYVAHDYVNGRETSPHGTRGRKRQTLTSDEHAAVSHLRSGGGDRHDVDVVVAAVLRLSA